MQAACLLQFAPVTVGDLAQIAPYFEGKNAIVADHSALYLYMWGPFLGTEYAISDGVLFLRRNNKYGVSYYPPLGLGEMPVGALVSRLACLGEGEITLTAVPADAVEEIERVHNVVEKSTSRRWADYIYSATDLATLSGNRYHKKRNLVRQFERLYPDHTYEDITAENLGEVVAFMHRFVSEGEMNEDKLYENERVLSILSDYDRLPVLGGLVRVGGEIAAFTVAEQIDDTLLVHVEKADRRFKGAYQYINNRFVREQLARRAFRLVNREDDSGDEGLRQAKMTYCPIDILHKYRLTLKF